MQRTSSYKEQHGISLTETPFGNFLRNHFHSFLMKLAASSSPFKLVVENDYYPLPDRPIIFTANHYCGQDIVLACNALKKRTIVVAGKQNLAPVDEFFFHANGTIFVDRKNPTDTAACKRAMEAFLNQNKNVLIFPEGTSNVSDCLLMYPMKWGVIEVAKNTGAQIIPLVLDYDKEKKECHARFGESLIFDDIEKAKGIELLRDTMATLRWTFFERKTVLDRSTVNIENLRKENMELLLSYKLLDYEYERSVVFDPQKKSPDLH